MKSLITRSIVAAVLTAATPLAANAAQSTPIEAVAVVVSTDAGLTGPIRLDNATIQPALGWQDDFAYPGLTVVRFTNLNVSPATDVVFTVLGDHGQILGRIEDAGSYAQGRTVQHTFVNNQADPNQHLTVEQATFADGSVWTNPGPATPVGRRQSR